MKRFYLNAKNIVQLTQILVAAITESFSDRPRRVL